MHVTRSGKNSPEGLQPEMPAGTPPAGMALGEACAQPSPNVEAEEAAAASAKGPLRTCVGCRESVEPEAMLRVVLAPGGILFPDLVRRAPGRGAWVHLNDVCLGKSVPRGFARSFRGEVRSSLEEFVRAIREAGTRRVEGLLGAALRARKLEVGTSAVREACVTGTALGILVATDARAAADSPWVQQAIASGRALAWGTKDSLGSITRRDEVAVVAVTDAGFCEALSIAVRLSQYPLPSGKAGPPIPQGSKGGSGTGELAGDEQRAGDPSVGEPRVVPIAGALDHELSGAPSVRRLGATERLIWGACWFAPAAFPLSGLGHFSSSRPPQVGGSTEV